jgi:hypothetical protein
MVRGLSTPRKEYDEQLTSSWTPTITTKAKWQLNFPTYDLTSRALAFVSAFSHAQIKERSPGHQLSPGLQSTKAIVSPKRLGAHSLKGSPKNSGLRCSENVGSLCKWTRFTLPSKSLLPKGYAHVSCHCLRCRVTRMRSMSWLPKISMGLDGLAPTALR